MVVISPCSVLAVLLLLLLLLLAVAAVCTERMRGAPPLAPTPCSRVLALTVRSPLPFSLNHLRLQL